MTHPYAKEDPEKVGPEDGPNPVRIRYGAGAVPHELMVASAGVAMWIPIYLWRDMGWFAYAALAVLYVLISVAVTRRRRRIKRESPVLLTLTDSGLRHWNANGTRLEGFTWDEVRSIELEPRPLLGPVLAVKLTDEARGRLVWGAFGAGKPRTVDADYVIDLSLVEGSAEDVMDAVDAVMEGRRLEEVRAARAQLNAGDSAAGSD